MHCTAKSKRISLSIFTIYGPFVKTVMLRKTWFIESKAIVKIEKVFGILHDQRFLQNCKGNSMG